MLIKDRRFHVFKFFSAVTYTLSASTSNVREGGLVTITVRRTGATVQDGTAGNIGQSLNLNS